MDDLDQTLENIVRDWVASDAQGRADIVVNPAARGGPATVEVQPRNPAALRIALWVADDGAHIGFSIGGGSWWADHVPLERESVREVLSAVAEARAGEAVRRLGGRIIARRGYIELGLERRLKYGQLNPLSIVPGLRWEPVVYQPY
jgi:hypothetical protein